MPELEPIADLCGELERLLRVRVKPGSVLVSRRTLRIALQRSLAGEIFESELTEWANMLETYDQVQYELGFEKTIADAVFAMSSPEVNGPLNKERCEELLRRLA